MTKRKRAAVLISGRGSNMASLIAAAARPDYPAAIATVISNRANAPGLALACEAGIPATLLEDRGRDRASYEAEITSRLVDLGIDIICLAGFMRVLSAGFVEAWRDRLLNIHPSLLPAFPGLDTHARALAAGVRIHGCTVHYVREKVDDGPIVAQAAVPVLAADTADTLAARVLTVEHRIYPWALALVASDRARVEGTRVLIEGAPAHSDAMLISPAF